MYTNNLEIIVYAPIKKVWKALTDADKIKVWMKNVKVETDWKEGSSILFMAYDNFGNIMTWEGKQMIWDGIIEKFVPGKELVVIYQMIHEKVTSTPELLKKINYRPMV